MTNRIADISPRQAAIIVGVAFLLRFIPVIFAQFFVRSILIVPGDAATTAANIMANEGLFRLSIASWPIVFTLDVVITLGLYVLLKPVNKSLALLQVWFTLIHVAIAGINVLNDIFVLLLLSGADYLTVFEPAQLHALVLLFLNMHSYGFALGIVFFGLHLFVVGYLVFKSGYFPRILGVLLVFAGLSYLIDSFSLFLIPNYAISPFFALAIIIAESAILAWLLWKGVRNEIPEIKY